MEKDNGPVEGDAKVKEVEGRGKLGILASINRYQNKVKETIPEFENPKDIDNAEPIR